MGNIEVKAGGSIRVDVATALGKPLMRIGTATATAKKGEGSSIYNVLEFEDIPCDPEFFIVIPPSAGASAPAPSHVYVSIDIHKYPGESAVMRALSVHASGGSSSMYGNATVTLVNNSKWDYQYIEKTKTMRIVSKAASRQNSPGAFFIGRYLLYYAY